MKDKRKLLSLYLLCSFCGIILFFMIFIFKPKLSIWLVMEHNFKYTFSDFFRQIVYASDLKHIYFNTTDAPFPPLAYCFFHLLWKINPINYVVKFESWKIASSDRYNLIIMLIVFSLFILAFYYIITKILNKQSKWKNLLLLLSILLSAPFLAGVFERGNPAFFVLVFLLYAMYFKDNENKTLRELSLLFIALASAFKIYPAIFGLLYIKEKRYPEFFRFVVYFMLFFFLPYIFTGSIDGMINHSQILSGFQHSTYFRWTSIRCFFFAFLKSMGFQYQRLFVIIGIFLENLLLFIIMMMFYQSNKKWKTLLYLSVIMSIYINNSYRYTSIYMIIPLLFLMKDILEEKSNLNHFTYIYIILFALIFTIPIYGIFFEVDFFIFVPIYIILIISIIEDIFKLKRKKNQ